MTDTLFSEIIKYIRSHTTLRAWFAEIIIAFVLLTTGRFALAVWMRMETYPSKPWWNAWLYAYDNLRHYSDDALVAGILLAFVLEGVFMFLARKRITLSRVEGREEGIEVGRAEGHAEGIAEGRAAAEAESAAQIHAMQESQAESAAQIQAMQERIRELEAAAQTPATPQTHAAPAAAEPEPETAAQIRAMADQIHAMQERIQELEARNNNGSSPNPGQ